MEWNELASDSAIEGCVRGLAASLQLVLHAGSSHCSATSFKFFMLS